MRIVTARAGHAVAIHHALHEVVALHAVLVCRAIREMREGGLAELVFFEVPEILQLFALLESRRPVHVLAFDRVMQRLSL